LFLLGGIHDPQPNVVLSATAHRWTRPDLLLLTFAAGSVAAGLIVVAAKFADRRRVMQLELVSQG